MSALHPPRIQNKDLHWKSRVCPPIQACILYESLGSVLTLSLSLSGLGSSDASFEVEEIEVCL